MSKSILILTIATVTSVSASTYFWNQTQHERQRAAALETRVAELERTQTVERDNPFAAPAVEQTETPAPATSASSPPATAATAVVTSRLGAAPMASFSRMEVSGNNEEIRKRIVRQQQALMNDPEYREAMRTQHRMGLNQSYPDLAEELGLSAEQANRFLDLLVDQQLRFSQDADAFSGRPSDPTQIAEMQRKAEERHRANQAEIAALLGDGGMQQWQEYQQTMGSRFRIRQLSSALEGTGSPLTPDQAKPLRQALAQREKQMMQEMQRNPPQWPTGKITASDRLKLEEDQLERMEEANKRTRAAVSHILTSDQLEAYERMHEQELKMQRAHLRIQRAQIEAQIREGLPTDDNNGVYSSVEAVEFVGTPE